MRRSDFLVMQVAVCMLIGHVCFCPGEGFCCCAIQLREALVQSDGWAVLKRFFRVPNGASSHLHAHSLLPLETRASAAGVPLILGSKALQCAALKFAALRIPNGAGSCLHVH